MVSIIYLSPVANLFLKFRILKIFRNNKIILGILVSLLELYFIIVNGFSFINHYPTELTHTFVRILVYLYIGYLFAEYSDKLLLKRELREISVLFGTLLFAFFVENIIIHSLGGSYTSEEVLLTLPTSIALFLLAINISPRLKNSIHIRRMSTFIYCVQVWPITIMWLLQITSNHIIIYFIVVCMILIAYYFCMFLSKKVNCKYLDYLV
ncbi:hypothetical protein DN440_10160 [Lactobacillus reuteri]|nr:hypothetical protein [Limosilactobacillus reuteri]